jgi:hypothetical protein
VNYGSAVQQTVVGLSPNTTYTCTGWFKVAAAGQNVFFMAQNYGGTAVVQWASTTTYTLLTLTFTTGSTNTSALIGVYQSGGAPAYCDDFDLSVSAGLTNLLTNPGFETGNTSGWVGGYGTRSAVNGNARSGAYAAQVQTISALQQTVSGLLPNTTYTCTGWLKVTTAGQHVYLIAQNYGLKGAAVSQFASTTTYTPLAVTFITGATNTSAVICVYQSGADPAYCDDFSFSVPTQ